MICRACRDKRHLNCLELLRQNHGFAGGNTPPLAVTELKGSAWCDCQHVGSARPGSSEVAAPTLDT